MLRHFDPASRGRGFFKRTGKEILNMKLTKKSKAIKKSTIRMKNLDEIKKRTEESLQKKGEKLKRIKLELDSIK